MPQIPANICCGCTACYNICPKDAIRMTPDDEGFSYPVVDKTQCISCGLCENVCPILQNPSVSEVFTDCVVVQNTSKEVLNTSTSGGFIDALYRYVLEEQNGYASGVIFDEQFMPVHIITNSYTKAKEFRNSKYAQSELNTIFRDVQSLLRKGKQVVFVGTPCQIAGLKTFLSMDYENLITVDLVCRSIPSPKLWRKYLQWQEYRHKDQIKNVSCRKKTYGYHSGALEIQFMGGKSYRGSNRIDYYMKSFHHDICSRPSCYRCPFKTKHRCSDFTVFDSWKPELVALEPLLDNDRGYSNVIAHTTKGHELLSNIKDIVSFKADPERMFCFTGGMESKSILYPDERNTFYQDLEQIGFEKTVKKYISVTWMDKVIEQLKPIRYVFKKLK